MSTPIAAPNAIHFSMLCVAAPIVAPMAIPRATPIVITIALHLRDIFNLFCIPQSAPFKTVAVKSATLNGEIVCRDAVGRRQTLRSFRGGLAIVEDTRKHDVSKVSLTGQLQGLHAIVPFRVGLATQ